jgi:hypothetical protein
MTLCECSSIRLVVYEVCCLLMIVRLDGFERCSVERLLGCVLCVEAGVIIFQCHFMGRILYILGTSEEA